MTHSLQLLHLLPHLFVRPSLVWFLSVLQGGTPHQPWKWTLTPVESPQAAQTVLSNRGPTFSVPSCTLILAEHCEGGGKSAGPSSGTVSSKELKDMALMGHYICPSSNPGRSYCNQPGHYLCAYWDCVTLARDEASYWTVKTDQFLELKLILNTGCTWDWFFHSPASKRARCTQLNLTVLHPDDQGWLLGRTWGVRRFEYGYDQGGFFTIRKEPAATPVALGPNLILNPNPPIAPLPNNPRPASPTLPTTPRSHDPDRPVAHNPYLPLLQASFLALNHSSPNLTEHCWLCLVASPPYYEAFGLNASCDVSQEDDPLQCRWSNRGPGNPGHSLTLSAVIGRGNCVAGKSSHPDPRLCSTTKYPSTGKYLIPPAGAHWLCSRSGLQPCVSPRSLTARREFCTPVTIVPRMTYYAEQDLLQAWDYISSRRWRREPVTIAVTVATLLAATGAGVGIATLATQAQVYHHLRKAVDEDIARLESSINFLKRSHASLTGVTLQNRWGLDLLFLKEGGLCVALGEECCFYVNHSGIIKDSLSKLREGLEARLKERESASPWYTHLFNSSPWLTTLVTSLMGPLLILILLLTVFFTFNNWPLHFQPPC
uniref:Retroviral envelope protein GP41-like domain-containing protein n=1 Tax=Monodelphis domestica TaxID=13616 RepID=A0A5F8GDY3_MONDO